jgi:hypothetical protein
MSMICSGSLYTFLICFGGTMTTGPRSMQGMMNGELALQYCHFAARSASLSVEADQKIGREYLTFLSAAQRFRSDHASLLKPSSYTRLARTRVVPLAYICSHLRAVFVLLVGWKRQGVGQYIMHSTNTTTRVPGAICMPRSFSHSSSGSSASIRS